MSINFHMLGLVMLLSPVTIISSMYTIKAITLPIEDGFMNKV